MQSVYRLFTSRIPPLFCPSIRTMHHKCINCTYVRDSSVIRFPIPKEFLSWSVTFPQYAPVQFTTPGVLAKPVWADPDPITDAKWNSVDGKVDRRSFTGRYEIVDGLPRNPVGRTGMTGRGSLGRWGPNHAADPIVTTWKRDEQGRKVHDVNTRRPILKFVAIERRDNGEWAIPGGMVDPGDNVSATMKREFGEEALNTLSASDEEKAAVMKSIEQIFKHGKQVYQGYVDDPRNTDNAWMETVACNFHDDNGRGVGRIKLHAGDDAVGVRWADIHSGLKLYASHADFIHSVADLHKAHW